jgi:hypothetical protein
MENNYQSLRNYIQDVVDGFEFEESCLNAHVQGDRDTFYT